MNKIIIANWKMNLGYKESIQLAKQYVKKINKSKVVIAPSFLAITKIKEIVKDKMILASQDCSIANSGSYTGDVSAKHLADLGLGYVIVGHSERRKYYQETNKVINKKIKVALENELIPILCIGEGLVVRESGQIKQYLRKELKQGLKGLKIKNNKDIIIAYEPIWAIGKVAIDSDEAEKIHLFIKQEANKILGKKVKVIYGGSVNIQNASKFLSQKNVDGLLIGGASLKINEFSRICQL